jgi:hypothetical protein
MVSVLTDRRSFERRLEFHDSTLIAVHHAGDVDADAAPVQTSSDY